MSTNYGQWKPVGDQFEVACKVCINGGNTETLVTPICRDCRSGEKTGFEFSPRLYIEQCQKNKEKYFFDGDKYYCVGGMRGAGRIFHLERALAYKSMELKAATEARDAYKQLADDLSSIIKEMVRKQNK